ncbi:putative bifunctional diguanylate cyclase/phosphodiesterase [Thioalkalivibrio denitrificans]|uniref:putative bifunctional diguanylate cyclase/phosphodiesterase n=1 Tax=Thioalkalivibrio denitrificans TaxID=108003 RepID=UPI001115ACC6|nr:GGDEF domain-containing protein [Thioalkalivibrio denitrificans]
MAGDTTPAFNRLAGRIALRIAAIYLVLGLLWIALSDRALMALVDDPRTLTWLQTIKGWAYVAVTALLLYALVFWQTRRVARANEALEERDRHITRLNRVYAMLNAINGGILRIRHRDTLLNETCRIAVEKGGFPLAWVGLAEEDGTRVRPVSSAGEGLDCLDGLELRIDPGDPDAHPMAKDLAAGRPFVIDELAAVPPMDACHARARELGFRSVAVVPIVGQSRLMGVMGFFVRERRGPAGVVFDEGELQLLTELAADTGIGLTLIEQGDALDRAARFDPLTGLANRSLLEERIGQALMRARFQRRSVGVMALEVIGLRSLVDSLGRQQGDRLQQAVAARLVNRVREGDTVAYLGNGEFAVLLADVRTGLDVSEVAEKKLLVPFELELDPGAPPLVVKLSAGAAVFPGDADTPESLLQCAGVALHQGGAASHAGRCVFYAPEMDEQVREYQMLDNELHGALERGEMALHFQPIVHLDSGEVIGMEALLRWHNRRFGPVAPDRFIPIAEHSGLIRTLGDWVLDTACAQVVRWRERGWRKLAMSVNLSVRQLLAPGFDERVREIVMTHRLDPDDMPLVLEVTETAVIEDMEAVSAALDRLKRLGIAVHLDDFGTGYASLSYLQQLPVDALKIDKSFVQSLESDPVAENLVRSVIVLAQGLELALVAEGVETPGQRDKLMELGCDVGQGYLFARPQPVDAVDHVLADSLSSVQSGRAERY